MSAEGPVFVVGCPRSGTSPVAKWLAACGLRTADDRRRQERYPAGYYEHMPVLMFHKALERLPRGADHAIRLEPFLRSEYLQDPFIRLLFEAAFREVLDGSFQFLKFPQLALSMDFLFEQFPGAHVLGLWRDPATTFRSLMSREFPSEMLPASGVKAVLLWSIYARHIVEAKARRPEAVTVIDIDRLLDASDGGASLLARMGMEEGFVPVRQAVNEATWNRKVALRWRATHRLALLVGRAAARRLGSGRSELADQVAWVERLRAIGHYEKGRKS